MRFDLTLEEHEEQASVYRQMLRCITPEMYEDMKARHPERVKRYVSWENKRQEIDDRQAAVD